MVNSEESFIGDEEPKKVDDDEGKPYQGKILITRYQPSLNATHNASIATVNALQEPGSITTLLPKLGQGEPFRRIPHLIDVLTMIDRNFPRRINEETHTLLVENGSRACRQRQEVRAPDKNQPRASSRARRGSRKSQQAGKNQKKAQAVVVAT
mmetsp:Transcript_16415/g.26984  ORF Transcript_16415/g.26984 Transcript_16415/m.26984 type:complete len:153 (-) Transcript_16415:23-481(-)